MHTGDRARGDHFRLDSPSSRHIRSGYAHHIFKACASFCECDCISLDAKRRRPNFPLSSGSNRGTGYLTTETTPRRRASTPKNNTKVCHATLTYHTHSPISACHSIPLGCFACHKQMRGQWAGTMPKALKLWSMSSDALHLLQDVVLQSLLPKHQGIIPLTLVSHWH